ncbi:MAG: SPFH domain-containing protein [Gemmataceae bacterium]
MTTRTLRVMLIGAVALYLLTGLVQVRRGERAVVRRFGRVLDQYPEPGLWVGLPWGMDRVDRVEVDTVRSVEVGYGDDQATADGVMPAGQLLTGDHNLVNVRAVLYYKVRPEEAAAFVVQGGRVAEVLTRAVEAAVAGWTAGKPVDDVLLRGKTAMRSELIARVREFIEPYHLGIEVLDARVARVAPPDEVRDAFDSVSRAQTGIATLRYRAEQEAASRQRAARAEAYRIDQSAHAYAHGRRVLATQDAQRFTERLRQYQAARGDNPDYLRQIWQEERGKVFSRLRDGGGVDLLDHRLQEGGLDVLTAPAVPEKR